jgi:hypothetical protein
VVNIKAAVFWGEKPCTMVGINVSEEYTASIFRVEDGGNMLLRNIGNNLKNYMTSHDFSMLLLLIVKEVATSRILSGT